MYSGERVVLRAIEREDVDVLWRWRNDGALQPLVSSRPPVPASRAAMQDAAAAIPGPTDDVEFGIDVDGRLVGRAVLYDIDTLARSAAVGVTIGESADRGKGYGREAVAVLLRYAFAERNLHRVWLDALADNAPALRAYRALGFVEEGRLREHAWVGGRYVDVVQMGLLRAEHRGDDRQG